jgi:hypothetical protein
MRLEPLLEELRQSDLGGFLVAVAVDQRDEPRALRLRLALRASERVPFPLPLTRSGVADVYDDSPMAR